MNGTTCTIANQWNDFIENLCWLCKEKLKRHQFIDPNDKNPLKKLIEELKNELLDQSISARLADSYNAIEYQQEERMAEKYVGDDKAIYFLVGEMKFFNDRVQRHKETETSFGTQYEGSEEELDDEANTGNQVKGSAEKLLKKLWQWVRDLLDVLNEIIKILFATLA